MQENKEITLNEYYAEKIRSACEELQSLLIRKNNTYGSSVFESKNTFGKIYDASDGIKIRLSDKFKRLEQEFIKSGTMEDNDVIDAIGYMVLMLIQNRIEREKQNSPSGQVINQ